MSDDHILVTGAAGFIGSSLCEALLAEGRRVIGVDNFSPNYAEAVKRHNLKTSLASKHFTLVECDVGSRNFQNILSSNRPDSIVHLAATPGVRPSIEYVLEYVDNNVRATANLLAAAASAAVSKVIFASSSSVYGQGPGRPVQEEDALVPLSPYAATKVAGEALCRSFVASHEISVTCLRFFSVYGPRQRPDMAICKLAHRIESGLPFLMNGDGSSSRDYTYISDVVAGIVSSLSHHGERFDVFNLGSGNPIELKAVISLTSEALGRSVPVHRGETAPCEPAQTFANVSKAEKCLGYRPLVDFRTGVSRFAEWFVASRECEGVCEAPCM